MNPTYVNRNELLKKISRNVYTKPQESNIENSDKIIGDNTGSLSESLVDNEKSDKQLDIKQLSIKHIALLPSIKDSIIRPNEQYKYIYKLSDVLNTDINHIKSTKLINLCVFNIS